MNKITVIHHSADFDGRFCREIAKKFRPDAELIGWDFGDKPLIIPDGPLYVLDLPLDAPFGFDYRKIGNERGPQHPAGLVWIDHHKSSIESHPKDIPGYRIDGVAACRLAWQWFSHYQGETEIPTSKPAALKEDYVNRTVLEPLAVRLAGEYDIWDKRDPNADVFQFGLRSKDLSDYDWKMLLDPTVDATLAGTGMDTTNSDLACTVLLQNGHLLQRYQQANDKSVMNRSFMMNFEDLKFLALNTPRCNSLTFASKDVPETGHDALMGFCWDGQKWKVSLYHAKHRTDLDLSLIATKYGGGGHKGACGFQAAKLSFAPTL